MIRKQKLKIPIEGSKRQHIPYLIEWNCVKCGTLHRKDFSQDHYFSYPQFGETFVDHLYCDECDYEMPVRVCISISVMIEPDYPLE